jgi:hypothetical protein
MSKENRDHAATLRRSIATAQFPRQDFIEPVDGVIVDAGQHVGEPRPRIDVRFAKCRIQRSCEFSAPLPGVP